MISVCIPSRADVLGLWATICACESLLKDQPHEFVVVLNGREMYEPEILIRDFGGEKVKFICTEEVLPPPMARNLAATKAKGEYLFFFDDHCIPARDYFDLGLEAMETRHILHSSYTTHVGTSNHYFHYIPGQTIIRGDYSKEPAARYCYRALSAPHGGFVVRRAVWESLGGYDEFWQGFGGEEAYFNLKAWVRGIETWVHPKMLYYHFSCRRELRGYDKAFNQENFETALSRLAMMTDIRELVERLRADGVACS